MSRLSELKLPAWFSSGSGITDVRVWLQWWREGLLGCLPDWLRNKLFPSAAPFIFQMKDKSVALTQPNGGELLELGGINLVDRGIDYLLARITKNRSTKLVLRVPREWVLTRRVSLPAAAGENLRQVVGFEMDRLTPFTPDQVFYDSRIVERNKDSTLIAIELAFLPRHRIKPWLNILTSKGVYPTIIDTEALWPGIDFLPPEERPRRNQTDRLLDLLLWVAPVVLLTLALAIPLWQKQHLLHELRQQVNEERRKADVVLAIKSKLEQSQKSERFLLEKRSNNPPVIDVVRLTTELLPDDTWIQQFTLKQGQLELRGMSNQATALIGLMEASPRLASVDFRSPVVQAKGQERFYLTAKLIAPKHLSPAADGKREAPDSQAPNAQAEERSTRNSQAARPSGTNQNPANPEIAKSKPDAQGQSAVSKASVSVTQTPSEPSQPPVTDPASRKPVRAIAPEDSE